MTKTLRFLAFAAAVLLSACGGGSLPSEEGNLRLVNATSDFASLDLFQTNSALITGVTPLSASGFAGLKNGGYSIDVRVTGSGTALVTSTVSLAKKDYQTVVAYSNAGSLALQVLSDKEGDPSSGNAKVRIFNAASGDTGGLDVYLTTAECSTIANSGSAPFAANLSGLQSTFTQVTASTTPYHVCVTTPGDKTELRLDIPLLTLSNQRIVTIVLSRSAGGFLVNGMTIDQQGTVAQTVGGSARLRVAASLSPPVPVDVTVNDKPLAAGLSTPNVAPYVVVPAGPLTIKINGIAYNPATPLNLAAGNDATLLLTGTTPTVTLIPDNNTTSTSSTRPVKIRLVNGLNGSNGAATLTVDNGVIGSAEVGKASEYSFLQTSAALARVEARSGTVSLFSTTGVTFSAGRVYTVFLLGDATAAPNAGLLIADR
ncbi:MAG: DUF4397 domain-containing protein [Myxococcales bacterium]|nr:DUF4397 domain-containing protein [Myxococcales bacterium]